MVVLLNGLGLACMPPAKHMMAYQLVGWFVRSLVVWLVAWIRDKRPFNFELRGAAGCC
jgi:hypothetical protein